MKENDIKIVIIGLALSFILLWSGASKSKDLRVCDNVGQCRIEVQQVGLSVVTICDNEGNCRQETIIYSDPVPVPGGYN